MKIVSHDLVVTDLTSNGVRIAGYSNSSRNGGGQRGYVNIRSGQDGGGLLEIDAGWGNGRDGTIDVRGENASIKKNNKEVATEEYVESQVSAKQDALPTLAGQAGTYNIKVNSANSSINAVHADSANYVPWSGVESRPTSLSGYGITDAATKSELDALAAQVGAANAKLEAIA